MRLPLLTCLVGCALSIAACSGDPPSSVGGPGHSSGGDPANGSGDGSGNDASTNGSSDGSNGSWGGDWDGGTVPILPPTSTPFHEDRTGQSGLDQGTLDGLKAGGASCGIQIVYPYEGTVFPGGLLPPPIMWTGGAEAAYVSMEYDIVDTVKYQYAAKSSGELTIPPQDWAEITRRTQGGRLKIKLSVKHGGNVSTCHTSWRVARGNMVGAIYYNTYNHPDTQGLGAIMRLTLGSREAQIYLRSPNGRTPSGPCRACHSVSVNGSMLVASEHNYLPFGGTYTVASYRVGRDPQPPILSGLADASFGALTPDGRAILQMGNPQCTGGASAFPRAPNNFPLLQGPSVASLLDTATGRVVQASGLKPEHYMWMPQFSPNGDKVVFNHAKPDGQGGTDRRELAVMDFDPNTNTFSNLRVIASKQGPEPSLPYRPNPPLGGLSGQVTTGNNDCGGPFAPNERLSGDATVAALPTGSCSEPCYPAWPFFTPDGNGVIYALVSEPDFTVAFPGRDKAAKSELWYVDLTTGQKVRLDNANKGLAGESTQINYYPTVLPVQVGGYYWLVWTSTRKWGTRSTDAPPGAMVDEAFFGTTAREAYRKRLWVSAIRPRLDEQGEFSNDELLDPSQPPFYLEGQSNSGNIRAFAALNPCEPVGKTCTSGLDCCTGFCSVKPGEATGTCVEEVMCSHTNERCETDEDCCPPEGDEPQNYCIGGYCGFVVVL